MEIEKIVLVVYGNLHFIQIYGHLKAVWQPYGVLDILLKLQVNHKIYRDLQVVINICHSSQKVEIISVPYDVNLSEENQLFITNSYYRKVFVQEIFIEIQGMDKLKDLEVYWKHY